MRTHSAGATAASLHALVAKGSIKSLDLGAQATVR
jgi:hypothetical protein